MFAVTVDDKAAQQLLKHLPKQAEFAGAMALTHAAKDAQQSVRESLPQRFTIRSNWVSKGIRITPAKKGRMVARVWSKDEFMHRQEYGGTKAGNVVVPYAARVGGYGGKGKTMQSRLPGSFLRQKDKYFVKDTPNGAALFKRMGGKKRKNVYRVVPHVMPRHFARSFEKTIATLR